MAHRAPPRLMCLATHHKGGTIWIKRVIKALSAQLGIPWLGIWSERRLGIVPEAGRAFLCNWAGHFPTELWARGDTAFLHIVRDPRDILLSGCRYHHHAPIKGERFLHVPRADLGGLTYQQYLNALPDADAKLRFEMGEKHALTMSEMLAWPEDAPRSMQLRYEDLMADTECHLFRAALAHLGLDADEQEIGARIFHENSLFGGLARPEARKGRLAGHIASGAIGRWRRELPRAVGEAYEARFGEGLVRLGYADGPGWARALPPEYAGPPLSGG